MTFTTTLFALIRDNLKINVRESAEMDQVKGGGDILLRGGVNKEILFCGSKSFRYKHRNIAKLFKSVILC